MRAKRLLLTAACVLAAILLLFYFLHAHHPAEAAADAPAAPPTVSVATARNGFIANQLTVAGIFQAFQEIDVHGKVSGYIRHIYVDIGDRVHQGQTLAVLEVPELQAEVAGAHAGITQTEQNIVRLQNEVAREQATYAAIHASYTRLKQASDQQPGLVAAQELDDALAKDRSAASQVDAAKSAVAAAQGQLGVSRAEDLRVTSMEQYATITAPYNGVVTMRYADTGALIPAGTSEGLNEAVVRLAQSDVLRLRMPVPERDVPLVHIGSQVTVHVQATGQQFPGTVVRYTRDVSNATRTMLTEVDVNNPGLTLTPGMYADVTFNLEQKNHTLIVTPNSGMHTAFVQVSLKEDHSLSSFAYMQRVRTRLAADLPSVQTYFQSGGLVDSIVNQGLPAPFDIQISSNDMEGGYAVAQQLAKTMRALHGVGDVLIPQDIDYPGLALNIDRRQASLEGLTPKTIVDSVITAMTSNGMVAPSYWIDPKTGNNYMLTVQYPETQVQTLNDFKQIPLRSADGKNTTPLETVSSIRSINTPTEVDHYQLRRVFDVYVMPKAENLATIGKDVKRIVADMHPPHGAVLTVRGTVNNMNESFRSFAIGLILSIVLVFLILMAQFASFVDPFIILLAIPPGLSGVILFLLVTGTTINIMSLMGVLMMTGIVVSDSILIVEFTGQLREQGLKLEEAIMTACKVRLRPILMTTLATVLGLIPMALALEAGSEQYAPLARAILGGLTVSGIVTVFLVPSAYLLIHRRIEARREHTAAPSSQVREVTA